MSPQEPIGSRRGSLSYQRPLHLLRSVPPPLFPDTGPLKLDLLAVTQSHPQRGLPAFAPAPLPVCAGIAFQLLTPARFPASSHGKVTLAAGGTSSPDSFSASARRCRLHKGKQGQRGAVDSCSVLTMLNNAAPGKDVIQTRPCHVMEHTQPSSVIAQGEPRNTP